MYMNVFIHSPGEEVEVLVFQCPRQKLYSFLTLSNKDCMQ